MAQKILFICAFCGLFILSLFVAPLGGKRRRHYIPQECLLTPSAPRLL
jgi:hypothetical protein